MRLCGSFARKLARPAGAGLVVFAAWAGRMPISENGMAAMIVIGVTNERNQPTTRM